MLDKKNIEAGNLIKLFIYFIIYIFFTQITYAQTSDNFIGTKTDIKIFLEKSSKSDQSKTLSNQYKDFKSNNDMYLDYGNFEIV